ncbi:MAG: 16S rRNA (uracil(1498)-N(3))-methyltransferase [Coriobacteriales bacterium]|nr:16S rRNA (uracil(1498)-N(3))-methyltransferase [Coriobacteriales bacterium]
MSLPHFFVEEISGGMVGASVSLHLDAETILHMRTLRLRVGEHVVVADEPGHGWELELTSTLQRHSTVVEGILISECTENREIDLTLVQGISATDRMDQTIRQVTELGVTRIIPLESERSNVRLEGETRKAKKERWQRIARSAAEQSGQLLFPQIEEPLGLVAAIALVRDLDGLLFFWEEPGGCSLTEALEKCDLFPKSTHFPSRIALFVGPEGGFSPAEASLLENAGAYTVTLGTTILRTETAAVVTCALALYHLGALGAR